MKSVILVSLIASTLLASVIETKEGDFLQIYAKKNPQADIVATVSINRGKIVKKKCFETRHGEWCKIVYKSNGININGYSDKETLESISTAINTKATFEKSYGGRYHDVGNAIVALEDGFLLVGSTESLGSGQKDAYVIKVDKFGNKIWEGAYGGRQTDIAKAVVVVDDGYMIAGSTASFGNRTQNIYLAKISKSGDLAWQNGYYSDEDDYYSANSMVKISATNMLLAGYEDHVKFFNSEVNGYVNAINSDGIRNGIKRYGGDDVDKLHSVISTSDGYLFAGESDSWGYGAKDAYVIKVNKDGDRVWHNTFGYRYDEVAKQILNTVDGGYIIVGSTDSDHRNQKDIFVVKIDKDGNKTWQYHYGSREHEEGNGIVEVADGYVIAGYTKNTKSYSSDIYLLKIDKNGHTVWKRKYGGEDEDRATAIVKVKDGFAISGYTTSPENHSKDLYLLRVNNDGIID